MLARDYRFDGKFFVGVKTTGVYCRPICPARPLRKNVEFFATALAAEKAGYRPCLRCRPEGAPGSPLWIGSSELVQRALKLIAANELTDENDFARRLGISARHLRRLFEDELGQTPKQISDNNRLNFARKLVVETDLPMITVASTAGFHSLRRFNDAFQKRFTRTPSQIRRRHASASSDAGFHLSIAYRPPLHWPALLQFYKRHHMAGIETVTDTTFARVFRIGETVGAFSIHPIEAQHRFDLHVHTDNPHILFELVRRVRKMFDLDSDPVLIANSFAAIPMLAQIHERHPGLRLPRGFDPYETAICSILGQLVSTEFAATLVHQLITAYGEEVAHPVTGENARLFPTPEKLAASDLAAVKTTGARKESIRDFSRRVLSNHVALSDAQDPALFRSALLATKGIGPWSAEYIALRAIGDTDAFPATDLILRRVLDLHPTLDLTAIKPWRSYAAMYLWKEFASTLSKKK
jgi:AraC family transcriptional regulator of adaptative response / DNA-3-methyladenine glycosylase II